MLVQHASSLPLLERSEELSPIKGKERLSLEAGKDDTTVGLIWLGFFSLLKLHGSSFLINKKGEL